MRTKDKSAKQIIAQFERIRQTYFNELHNPSNYKDKAEFNMATASAITRRYLSNIAGYFGMPYGFDTWREIGNNNVSSEIYKRYGNNV